MCQTDNIKWTCPTHQTVLITENETLICQLGCNFRVVNQIPRFVPDSSYTTAFGDQWNRYGKTQLDSYTGLPISESRLRRCLGEMLWNELERKQVLEAGCGAGRFTEILLEKRACVTSIDLSNAVNANQKNFPQNKSHHIAQADILQLPFSPQSFDIVLCLGVIQHTPNPEETIKALYEQVKPGGWLVIDHYTYKLSNFTRTAPFVRLIMRRLPKGESIKWTERIANILLPLHKSVRNFRLGQMLLSRVSPLVCYYHSHPDLSDELQTEWALLDTHDSLTDYYKHFRWRRQIMQTLENLELADIWCKYGGNGVEARGQRPSSLV